MAGALILLNVNGHMKQFTQNETDVKMVMNMKARDTISNKGNYFSYRQGHLVIGHEEKIRNSVVGASSFQTAHIDNKWHNLILNLGTPTTWKVVLDKIFL